MLDWLDGATTAVILFFIALAGMGLRKNMMITVIAMSVMNAAIILAFVTLRASPDQRAPMVAESVAGSADPLPQALMITTVVIGVAVQAVCLVLVLGHYRRHQTLDWDEARALRDGGTPAPTLAAWLRTAASRAPRPQDGTHP